MTTWLLFTGAASYLIIAALTAEFFGRFTKRHDDITDSMMGDAVLGALWPAFWAIAALTLTIGWIVQVVRDDR